MTHRTLFTGCLVVVALSMLVPQTAVAEVCGGSDQSICREYSDCAFTLFGVSSAADTFALEATWSARGEAGAIDSAGVFSGRIVGAATITAPSRNGAIPPQ